MEYAACTQNCLGYLVRPSNSESKLLYRTFLPRGIRDANFCALNFLQQTLYMEYAACTQKQFGQINYGRTTTTDSAARHSWRKPCARIFVTQTLYTEYAACTQNSLGQLVMGERPRRMGTMVRKGTLQRVGCINSGTHFRINSCALNSQICVARRLWPGIFPPTV